MELMITLIILSVIASIAVVNYRKLIAQQHFRKAYMNLIATHSRAHVLHAKLGDYTLIANDMITFYQDINLKNAGLDGGTVIAEDDYFDYSFLALTADTFEISAESDGIPWGGAFKIEADQNSISNANPGCDGDCPFKIQLP